MVNDRPFFSIITISFNAEKQIAPTLQSVADQQGVEGLVEHWVIDGASTDGTLDVARQFPHVRCLSEPDKGIADAFNKGMHHANGEYLLYLNCDDLLCDNKVLADLYAFAQSRNLPDWIVGRWYVRRVDGTIDFIRPKYPYGAWHLYLEGRICHQGVLLKREIQERLGGFDTDFRVAMDYDLWLRLAQAGYKITNFNRPLVIYADGGYSIRNEELARRDFSKLMQRYRNTPLKRVTGLLYDEVKHFYQRARSAQSARSTK